MPKGSAENQTPAKRMGRPPSPGGTRGDVVRFRVNAAYKEWLGRFVAHCQREASAGAIVDASTVLELGLEELARAKGFEAPPTR